MLHLDENQATEPSPRSMSDKLVAIDYSTQDLLLKIQDITTHIIGPQPIKSGSETPTTESLMSRVDDSLDRLVDIHRAVDKLNEIIRG